MLSNPIFQSWYTDTIDIYRVQNVVKGNLDTKERVLIQSGVKCRIAKVQQNSPVFKSYGGIVSTDIVHCDIDVDIKKGDIKKGDMLMIVRGGVLDSGNEQERYFAGAPISFYDPVGGVSTGLEHQEIPLLTDEIIK